MSNETDAKEIVALIRTQVAGGLAVAEEDAVRLVETALRVAEHRGCIEGMERLGTVVEKSFAAKAA